jgi:hypothetical protein
VVFLVIPVVFILASLRIYWISFRDSRASSKTGGRDGRSRSQRDAFGTYPV